jgi:hypothetical protein
MRLFFAALFVFAGLLVIGASAAERLPRAWSPWLMPTLLAALVGVAWRVFRRPGERWDGSVDSRAEALRLFTAGRIERRDLHAVRAFEIEATDGEGSHYVVELKDGACLLFNGQYLWDLEPFALGPWRKRRKFPCTELGVFQQRDGEVVHIDCGGEPLEPEHVAPAFSADERLELDLFGNSAVPLDRAYAELVREWVLERGRT